ncbi:hypothetical protein [Actinomadura sp. WAC 06369]|uniref:hypothetical protein n=1 Tax=Actinomadura sp. WAC 06369 TaxID=2203193 RepID=UPI000F7889D9|nr:hypothetical protein [Actinomadura sp. WAC 06369]
MTRSPSPRRLKQQVQDTVGEQVRDLPLHAVRLAMFGVGRALLLGDRVTRDYKEITEGGGVKPVIGRLRDDVQHTAEKVVGTVVERVRGEQAEPEPEPEPVRPRRTRPARPSRPSAAREDGAAARRRPDKEISVGKPGASDGPVAKPAPSPRPSAPRPEPAPQAEPAAPPVPEDGPAPEVAATAAPDAPAPEPAEPEAAQPEAAQPEDEFTPRPESRPAAQSEAEHVAESLPVPNYDEATLPQLRARLRGLSVEQVKLLREYERTHAGREDIIKMYERRIAKLNGQS